MAPEDPSPFPSGPELQPVVPWPSTGVRALPVCLEDVVWDTIRINTWEDLRTQPSLLNQVIIRLSNQAQQCGFLLLFTADLQGMGSDLLFKEKRTKKTKTVACW